MDTIYVLSAVPPNSNRLLRKYGLLSGVETIKHPDVLEAARPDAKDRRAFVKKVKEVIASDRPHSVMGPSVFFTPPDPEKITDKHFIKKWDLQTIRIDLGRLIEDYPDTIVWGAELLPYDKAWRKMSDDEFDEVMVDMGYASWEDFAAERSRALTLNEVRDFTQMRPEDLWEHYAKSDAGKMYASNVPHAFIITPMGYIPYEYIEYVDEARGNPEGYTLTIKEEPYRTVLEWRKDGESQLYAFARFVFDKDNVETILESQVSDTARDLAYDEDLDDDALYEMQDNAIASVTEGLKHETPVYLSSIKVLSEDDRGRGLGSELMRELETQLKENGIDTIYLQAVPSERAAWYQRLGFEIVFPWDEDIRRGVAYPILKKDI